MAAQTVKNLPVIQIRLPMQKTWVQSLGWEDLLEKGMATTPGFLPGKSHGQRSLANYSVWGHKESDMNEHLLLSLQYIHLSFSKICLLHKDLWMCVNECLHVCVTHRNSMSSTSESIYEMEEKH